MHEENLIPIDDITYVTETEGAFLVDTANGKLWIPKSQATYDGEEFEVNEWFANKEGLI